MSDGSANPTGQPQPNAPGAPGGYGPAAAGPTGAPAPGPGHHPGPPPSYGPPVQHSKPFGSAPGICLWLSVAAVAAVSVGVFVKEDDRNFWDASEVWSIFAIVAAAATMIPSIAGSAGWGARRAWSVGAIAAGGLFGWWVLIVLPGISSNLAFLNTAGTALGCAAAWLADGRPEPEDTRGPTTW